MIKIFVHAPLPDRIQRISRRNQVDAATAKDRILKRDRARANYYNYYTDQKWGNTKNYDLTFDTSKVGIDGAVELILQYIALFPPVSGRWPPYLTCTYTKSPCRSTAAGGLFSIQLSWQTSSEESPVPIFFRRSAPRSPSLLPCSPAAPVPDAQRFLQKQDHCRTAKLKTALLLPTPDISRLVVIADAPYHQGAHLHLNGPAKVLALQHRILPAVFTENPPLLQSHRSYPCSRP